MSDENVSAEEARGLLELSDSWGPTKARASFRRSLHAVIALHARVAEVERESAEKTTTIITADRQRDEARRERDRLRDVVEHHNADDEGLTFRVAMTKTAGDVMACVATGPADREEDIVRAAVKIMEAWDILAFQQQIEGLIADGDRLAGERDALRDVVDRQIDSLEASNTKLLEERDRLARILAVERGGESQAPEGWSCGPSGWCVRGPDGQDVSMIAREETNRPWVWWSHPDGGEQREGTAPSALEAMEAADAARKEEA